VSTDAFPDGSEADLFVRGSEVLAAVRSDAVDMNIASSSDFGRTWGAPRPLGFRGHAPHWLELRDGTLLLSHRYPGTAVHVSCDGGGTFGEAYVIDDVEGAYPSAIELKDGAVLFAYYEEGEGSGVRVRRMRCSREGAYPDPWP
jgi:hypothetical protein